MIIVTLRLKVVPEKRWAVIKTVHTIIGPTTVRSGCSHCSLYSNTSNDDELILLEKWESKEALERHLRSDEFRKIISVMETASEPPEIHFNTVTSIEGIELLEKILG
ncbi:putative quinol monooxygenase [Thermodesulfobacteriota bacterium]